MKLVHAHTVEGLYWRALAGKVPSALKEELKPLGLDLDGKPRDVEQGQWAQMLAVTVKHLYPHLSADDGYYRLGEAVVQGYENTIMGKALFAVMRMLGPHRVIKRSTANLQSANTFSQATVKQLEPNHYEVWTNECNGNANYLRALMFGALQRSGAEDLKIEVLGFDGHAATFDIRWA